MENLSLSSSIYTECTEEAVNNENNEVRDLCDLINPYFYIAKGKIIKFVKQYDINGIPKIGYCLTLESSSKNEHQVLICPITYNSPTNKNKNHRFELGLLPIVNNNKIAYAKINQIRFFDKKKILKSSVNSEYNGSVSESIIDEIQASFFSLIIKTTNKAKDRSFINQGC